VDSRPKTDPLLRPRKSRAGSKYPA